MEDSDKLSIAEVSSFVTSPREEIEQRLEKESYRPEKLDQLIEAERNGKDRKTVIGKLKKQKRRWQIEKDLELAGEEVKELEKTIEDLEEMEGVNTEHGERRDVGQGELVELLGKTVEELRNFVKEEEVNRKGLEKILEGEKKVKNRKTAKEFLERKIKQRKIEKDAERTEEDIKELKKDLQEVEGDEEVLEEASQDEEADSSEKTEEDMDEEDEGEGDEEVLEEKRKIAEELDEELKDAELKALSINDLRELTEEEQHRKELISALLDEGLDEDDLRNATNSDLEKLFDQIKDNEEDSEGSESDGKSEEEIREEAEEDLQMLMGAGMNESGDSEDDGSQGEAMREKIENFRGSLRDKMSREDDGEEGDSGAFSDEKVLAKLDSYAELDDREAAVKTAHILKGYLEYRLGIDRELTYGELAEELPVEEYSGMEQVGEFLEQMQREEYTQSIHIDVEDIIEDAEKAIRELEGE